MTKVISVIISVFALAVSLSSAVLSFRADRHAVESVRPYVSTVVSMVLHDMSVSLSNYGAGVAIVTKVSLSRSGGDVENSFAALLPVSSNYEVPGVVYFVQDQYPLRPGDSLKMVFANVKNGRNTQDALRDWIAGLDGIKIEIDYLDVFGKPFKYSRVISTKAFGGTPN